MKSSKPVTCTYFMLQVSKLLVSFSYRSKDAYKTVLLINRERFGLMSLFVLKLFLFVKLLQTPLLSKFIDCYCTYYDKESFKKHVYIYIFYEQTKRRSLILYVNTREHYHV